MPKPVPPRSTLTSEILERLRSDTPGVDRFLHFNNAGCALPPRSVVEKVGEYLEAEAIEGGYAYEAARSSDLQDFYLHAARLIHAKPSEIAFQGSATLAWRVAFNGLNWKPGDEILTTDYEYGSNLLAFIQAKEQYGVETRVVSASARHEELLRDLRKAISPRTRLLAISHIPSNAGYVHPAAEIGQLAKEHGLLYFLDACQSLGHCPVDVEAIGCDVLSGTGRKYLRGPRGTGFLYVREAVMEHLAPIHLDLLSARQTGEEAYEMKPDARRFETYENSRALQVGLSEALRYLLDLGIVPVWNRIQDLASALREGLGSLPGVTVADEGEVLSGIVTFRVAGQEPARMKQAFRAKGMNISVSEVGGAYHYMQRIQEKSLLRASVHCYNSYAEVEAFCAAVRNLA